MSRRTTLPFGTATITRKFRLTIPAAVARHLGLKRGDKLLFHSDAGGSIVGTPARTLADDSAGRLSVPTNKPQREGEQR